MTILLLVHVIGSTSCLSAVVILLSIFLHYINATITEHVSHRWCHCENLDVDWRWMMINVVSVMKYDVHSWRHQLHFMWFVSSVCSISIEANVKKWKEKQSCDNDQPCIYMYLVDFDSSQSATSVEMPIINEPCWCWCDDWYCESCEMTDHVCERVHKHALWIMIVHWSATFHFLVVLFCRFSSILAVN